MSVLLNQQIESWSLEELKCLRLQARYLSQEMITKLSSVLTVLFTVLPLDTDTGDDSGSQ